MSVLGKKRNRTQSADGFGYDCNSPEVVVAPTACSHHYCFTVNMLGFILTDWATRTSEGLPHREALPALYSDPLAL